MLAANAGLAPATIQQLLMQAAGERGIDVGWNYKDVVHRFRPSGRRRELDGAGFAALLQQRSETGLPTELSVSDTLQLSCSFAVLEGGLEEWASNHDRVLLFDPTAGTNMHGHKLALFLTINKLGKTQAIAMCTLVSETEANFLWALSAFSKHFKYPPLVFATDSCPAIESAALKLSAADGPWSARLLLLLCIFHISKNIYEHLRCLYVGNEAVWRTVYSAFWRLAKKTDSSLQQEWDTHWAEFMELVRTTAAQVAGKYDKALEWLEWLGSRAQRWAYRFTWMFCSLNINSTSRSESMNARLKLRCNGATLLTDLLTRVERDEVEARARHGAESLKLAHRHMKTELPACIEPLRKHLTPYALGIIITKAKRALQLKVEEEGSAGVFFVSPFASSAEPCIPCPKDDGFLPEHDCELDTTLSFDAVLPRTTTLEACSCQMSKHSGLICEHQIAVALRCSHCFAPDAIDVHWHLTTSTERARKLTALLRQPTPRAPGTSGPVPASLTRQDRYQLAMSVMRPLAELASHDDVRLNTVRMHILDLVSHFENNTPLRWANPDNEPTLVEQKTKIERLLGSQWRVARMPDPSNFTFAAAAGRSFLKSKIVILWSPKTWYMAEIIAQVRSVQSLADEIFKFAGASYMQNFQITFPVDATTAFVHLAGINYFDPNVEAKQYTWALLEEKPLSSNVAPEEVTVASQNKRGRPPTKRLRPVAGPTSDKRKGGAKGTASKKGGSK